MLRYRLRFVVLLLFAPVALGVSTGLLFRTYEARAGVWIDSPGYIGQSVEPAQWNPRLQPSENASATLRQYLRTRSFGSQVGDQLSNARAVSNEQARAALAASLGSETRVTTSGSHLVEISYSSSRPALAVAVLRAVIAVYLEQEVRAEQAQLEVSTTFLSTKVTSAEAASAATQQSLNAYLAAHPGLHTPSSGNSSGVPELDRLAQQFAQGQADLTQLRAELTQARFLGDAAQRVAETNSRIIDEPTVVSNGLLGDGRSLLAGAMLAVVTVLVSVLYLVLLVWTDQTVRDPKELERRLRVPVLTSIPLIGIEERF